MSDQSPVDPYAGSPYPASDLPTQPQPPAYPPTAAYPQAGYPQQPPAYEQAGYPQQPPAYPPTAAYPAAVSPVAEPPRKKRLWLWLTLGAILLVLCCGGGIIASLVVYDSSKSAPPTAETSATPSPTGSTSEPSPGADTVTLTVPAQLGGYPKLDDPTVRPLLDAMTNQLRETQPSGVTEMISGLYGDPAKRQMRMFIAAKMEIADPDAMMAGMVRGFKNNAFTMGEFTTVPPGPLGGAARCGDVKQGALELTLCAWADRDSFGLVFFYFTKVSKAKSLFVQIRGEIESRP